MLSTQFLSEDSENILKIIRFNAILNLAKRRDKATLQQFINQGGELDFFLYNKNSDTTPIRFLAANGDHESVDFFIENTKGQLKEILINEALQGYAIAANHEKVELFLENHKADIDKAVLGYIKGKHITEALDFVEKRGADPKNALFHFAIRAYKRGVDRDYARGVQALICYPGVGSEMKSILDLIFRSYNHRKKPIIRQSLIHLFSCINNDETKKQALKALDYAQRYDHCFTADEISTIVEKALTIHHLMQDEKNSFEQARLLVNEGEETITIKGSSNQDDQSKWQKEITTEGVNYSKNPHKNKELSVSHDRDPNQTHITLIGDSTIDNKIWVDGIVCNYLKDHLGITRDDSKTRIQKYNANGFMKPELSIVEHLTNTLPEKYQIVDLTNDGFTTKDCLEGNMRSKVFGPNTFKLFPNEKFSPLKNKSIQKSSHIILSIGGNNFREFLIKALKKTGKERKDYIKEQYPTVMDQLKAEYIAIVTKIRKINPTAKLILLTQYYPSVTQNNYGLYPFLQELGGILGFGNDPMDTIQKIMQDTYQIILKEIINGCDLSLLCVDDVNIIDFDHSIIKAKSERTPILIKFQNEFFIYGDLKGNGEFRCTKLNSKEFRFDDLPFQFGRMNHANLLTELDLLPILASGHAAYNRPSDKNVIVVDVTSSLDPYEDVNFINQIEPSGKGGEKIAHMLNYVVHDDIDFAGCAIRFLPGFFSQPDSDSQEKEMEVTQIDAWKPIHPKDIKLPRKTINECKDSNNRHAFQLRDLFFSEDNKLGFTSSIFTTIEVHRARWIKTSTFRDQIENIKQNIQRLDHFYHWNGAKKANEILQALNRAIDAELRGQQFASIEEFQSFKLADNLLSLNEALNIHRHGEGIDAFLKINEHESSKLVRVQPR